jgi:hypothetical protein
MPTDTTGKWQRIGLNDVDCQLKKKEAKVENKELTSADEETPLYSDVLGSESCNIISSAMSVF